TAGPCCRAKALTHWPIPCCPGCSAALHLFTCATTCVPQSLGFRLPVIVASVAPAAASTPMANPVTTFAASAAPVPPRIFFMNPPEAGDLQAGIDAESTGPRTRSSSRSISLSKSLMLTSIGRDAVLLQSTQLDLRLPPTEVRPQPRLRGREPRRDRPLWDPERRADLPVGVPVVVAQHDRRRLLGRQLAEGADQV